jgi:hypothetical protein
VKIDGEEVLRALRAGPVYAYDSKSGRLWDHLAAQPFLLPNAELVLMTADDDGCSIGEDRTFDALIDDRFNLLVTIDPPQSVRAGQRAGVAVTLSA